MPETSPKRRGKPRREAPENPVRRCLATGEVADKSELVRFVVGPDAAVAPDVDGKLPGRGMWVSASREAVERAVAKRLFSRAAKRAMAAPADLADTVEALLARRCLSYLGLAVRAGEAVAGFEKVREELRKRQAVVLLAASDAAHDGRDKLARLAHGVPVVGLFTRAELSLAIGRENVVHAALRRGGLADRFVVEAARLSGFRGSGTPTSTRGAGSRTEREDVT